MPRTHDKVLKLAGGWKKNLLAPTKTKSIMEWRWSSLADLDVEMRSVEAT